MMIRLTRRKVSKVKILKDLKKMGIYIFKFLPVPICEVLMKMRGKFREMMIRLTRRKVSKVKILKDLKKMGIEEGDVLFVFSSLKSIGYVLGGPQTVIDALIEALGPDGTLVLPSFYFIRGEMTLTLEANRIFDPKTTPTVLGLIPETFRKSSGVYKSIHPTHSVCAFGPKAKWITEGHENCTTTFGRGTPFDKIIELNGKILGLGVHIGVNTFYHHFEDVVDNFPLNIYCEKEYETRVIVDGKIKRMKVKAHNPEVAKTRIERNFFIRKYFTDYLISRRVLKMSYVGEAKSWVINARDLIEALKELLKKSVTIYTTKEELQK